MSQISPEQRRNENDELAQNTFRSSVKQRIGSVNFSNWGIVIITLIVGIVGYALNTGSLTFSQFVPWHFHLLNPDYNRAEMLNRSFVSSKSMMMNKELISVQKEMFHVFNSTLHLLHQCNSFSKYLFFGESGIGKTTVMKAVLHQFQPTPFIYIDLEAELSWKDVVQGLGISSLNENYSLNNLVYHTLINYTTIYKKDLIHNCPIIILDAANRKPDMTNKIIQFLRKEPMSTVALVVLSSDRDHRLITKAGGRVKRIELTEASKAFGVEYLKEDEIPNDLIEGILEITGQKMMYLQTAKSLYKLLRHSNNTEMFFQQLREEVFDDIFDFFVALSLPYQHAIFDLGTLLINSTKGALEENVWLSFLGKNHPSIASSNKRINFLFNANLIRKTKRVIYFQNAATENYFKKNIQQLCEHMDERAPGHACKKSIQHAKTTS
ncbi:hypothetical protein C9374_003986 [Naegleria lovaniensis]|uniref:AAA+ ATPase domain-containing protein n=1 Tax=Naegleria lovaniensis TaxID=51637 RepID=A0AA88KSJ1_NAELO|nr:uncharacterized protein C9374_003986 [Naegleria lovaniensis]KAG2394222.1 hypothetical protein C9374_003986 [Naegleria lovaniensis]